MMNKATFSIERFAASLLRIVYLPLLLAILLPLGAVDPLPLHLVATLSFIVTALALVSVRKQFYAKKSFVAACSVTSLLCLWIVIQATPLPFEASASSIWATAERFYGASANTISVAPADTMQGVVAVLLPFSVFLSGLLLFSSDERAESLLLNISLTGGALAAFSLIQFLFFPANLMFGRKTLYLDSLTSVFVNHNTAATYLGMTMILAIALAFSHIQNAGPASLVHKLLAVRSSTSRKDMIMFLLHVVSALLSLIALLLTKSRAGVAASIMGLLVMTVLLVYHGGYRAHSSHRSFVDEQAGTLPKLARAGLSAIALGLVGLVFSGQVLFRAESLGSEDGRFCIMPALIRLARDNWLTGTGLGTFRMVFPAYKDPGCGLYGTWERAHNFYLDGWIALGLPFVVATAVIVVMLFWLLIKGILLRRKYRWAPVAGLAILTLQLTHNVLDFSIQIPGIAAVFAAILAACLTLSAASGRRRQKSRSTTTNRETSIPEAAN